LAEVARVRGEIARCQRVYQAICEEIDAESARAQEAWTVRADPLARAMLLDFLAGAHRRRAQAHDQIENVQRQLAKALEEAERKRMRLEVLDQHRDAAVSTYKLEAGQREQKRADEDWSMRAHIPVVTEGTP
jgi:transcription initiation factor TFIIIB Brf1 subunit/transcription initiation factor TFIIB